jgi:hypothetical protein
MIEIVNIEGIPKVISNTKDWGERMRGKAVTIAKSVIVVKVLDYARQNAPWADRTGDARAKLSTKVRENKNSVVVRLAHGVPYGIFLELCNSGRYAIIRPTITSMGPEVMKMWADGLKGGS